MKRFMLCACILALLPLFACGNEQETIYTLYENDVLKIENKGHITTIYDYADNTYYTFEKHRVRKRKEQVAKEIKPSVDNDVLEITTIYGVIIVVDKKNNKKIYVK